MNNSDLNKKILDIQIENMLYPLISLLRQTNKSKIEIRIEIEKFKGRNKELLQGLDENYVETYLNQMYQKRNKGQELYNEER